MLNKKIAFIGPGVMAEAMIAGLLRQGLSKPEDLLACGPRKERCEELRGKYGIRVTTDNTAASEADVVVLSVKPQRLSVVLKGLKTIRKDALVLSIVAGAPIQKIGAALKHDAVVRSMPNTPGQIGQGITVWAASRGTSVEQHKMARQILGALGEEVFVEDEGYLEKAGFRTAISRASGRLTSARWN